MHLIIDPDMNIAYLRFHEESDAVETISLGDAINIDVAPDGRIYGIELLNANEQLLLPDNGRVIVTNAATGLTRELAILAA